MLAQDLAKDALTGVLSRAALNIKLQEEYERAQRYNLPFALLVLDLDHFKSVNDAFGHVRGDEVLIEFTQRATTAIRATDFIFRYGGDEFVILLPHTKRPEATRLAQRLLKSISDVPFAGKPPLSLGISVGVAAFPEDAESYESLFEVADQRNLLAKRSGRGCVIADNLIEEKARPKAPSRLLERDQAQAKLQLFFKHLSQERRGLFLAEGLAGAGHSRFLAEARKQAHLQGYAGLALVGQTGLKLRRYGVLTTALAEQHPYLASPTRSEQGLLGGLLNWLDDKGYSGLVVTIDNPDEIDSATLSFLTKLAALEQLPALALVWAGNFGVPQQIHRLFDASLQERVILKPLSLAGVRIWLRHSLQWEAPDALVEWVFNQTGGLPALIGAGLDLLLARNILRVVGNSWEVVDEWQSFPLAEELAQIRGGVANNLPTNLPELVGREAELRQIAEWFEAHRLVTIVGPGGIGKTRLALQVAIEGLAKYPQGVYFVPMAGLLAEEEVLLAAIGAALGLKLSDSKIKPQLFNYLSSKQLLLVLDNFEHLLTQASLLAELQNAAPYVRLLVTTRERLKLPVEQPIELSGLACAPGSQVTELENYAAVQLFVQSARLVKPDFNVNPENGAGVARVCRIVEGLPLGLNLAAAWVNVFSPEQLAKRLEERALDLLEFVPGGELGATIGGSLRGVLDAFWSLLGHWEREVLAHLAVFQGGFSQEAASEVAGASLFFLEGLVMRAFLSRQEQGYYQLHELLRQYLTQKLVDLAEVAALQRQHALYYLHLTERAEPELRGSQQVLWLNYLEREHDNLRAALQWAFSHNEREIAASLSGALWRFWEQHGHIGEGRYWLEASLAFEDVSKAARARVLNGAGLLAFYQADYEHAKSRQTESLKLWHALGNKAGIAIALNSLALALSAQGSYGQARQLFEESLMLRRELGDTWGVANCLGNLGQMLVQQEQCALAQPYLEESLTLRRSLNDKTGLGLVLNNLGLMAQCRRNYEQAQNYHAESLAINRELGNRYGIAVAMLNLGRVALSLGHYLEATRRFKESLIIVRELGDKRNLAACLELGAAIAAAQNQLPQAVRLLSNADVLRRTIGTADRKFYELVYTTAQRQLVSATFAAAWDEGQSLSLDKLLEGLRGEG